MELISCHHLCNYTKDFYAFMTHGFLKFPDINFIDIIQFIILINFRMFNLEEVSFSSIQISGKSHHRKISNKTQEGTFLSKKSASSTHSKYSSSSRLTKSRVFEVLSRKNDRSEMDELMKEKDMEIEILENCLEGLRKDHKSLLFKMCGSF